MSAADECAIVRRCFLDCGTDEVVAAAGQHMANATARVGNVAGAARDDVEMQVIHGLPGRCPDVDSDVVAVG